MIIIETRVESQTLAKLAKYYLKSHKIIRSRSHLVRSALVEFANLIDATEITPTEAYSILGELGITGNVRAQRSKIKELQEETLSIDSFDVGGELLATLRKDDKNVE